MKINALKYILSTAVVTGFVFGCAEDVEEPDFSISYPNYQNADEKAEACCCPGDEPSCQKISNIPCEFQVYQAAFDGNKSVNTEKNYEGYYGVIDRSETTCFTYGRTGEETGDIDYIKVDAVPGTPLNIVVKNTMGSKTDPVVTIYNSKGYSMFFAPSKDQVSELSFYAPDKYFYVGIEDRWNYQYYASNDRYGECNPKKYHGGGWYDYLMIVNNIKDLDDKRITNFEIELNQNDFSEINEFGNHTALILKDAEVHYFTVSVPNGVPLKYKLEPENINLCPLVLSYEDKNHQWGRVGDELRKYGYESYVKIATSMADPDKKADKDTYTLMVFNNQGEGNCKYKLSLSSRDED